MCDMVLTLTLFLRSHEPLHSCACMLERNILSKATEFAPGIQIRLVDRIKSGGERRMFVHTWGFNQSLLSTFHHFCPDHFEGVVCGIFFNTSGINYGFKLTRLNFKCQNAVACVVNKHDAQCFIHVNARTRSDISEQLVK